MTPCSLIDTSISVEPAAYISRAKTVEATGSAKRRYISTTLHGLTSSLLWEPQISCTGVRLSIMLVSTSDQANHIHWFWIGTMQHIFASSIPGVIKFPDHRHGLIIYKSSGATDTHGLYGTGVEVHDFHPPIFLVCLTCLHRWD